MVMRWKTSGIREDTIMKKRISISGWIVLVTAFILMGPSACSIDEELQPTDNTPVTYTLTVSATKGDNIATRALNLSADGKTLNATWAAGEEVQVYRVENPGTNMEMVSDIPKGTLSAQSDGAMTTLSGTFTGGYTPSKGDVLRLRFNDKPDYTNQGGTLDYIAKHCDYAEAEITVSNVDTETGYVTSSGTAEFQNQQAIVKFSLKQPDGTTPLAATSLTVKVDDKTYNVTPTVAASDIYVAIKEASNKAVTLMAISADADSYSYSKSGVSFDTSQYYAISVKMTEDHPYTNTVNLSTLADNYTVPDGYTILTGTLSGGYKISITDGATVKLKDVTIPGGDNNSKPWAGITCLGDATIRLSGTNSVKGYHIYYPGIQAGPLGTTLTIEGNGSLTATYGGDSSGARGAGIGGVQDQEVGNIVIAGGNITAEGHKGAGIGTGYASTDAGGARCGTITISGGTIRANSTAGGAGIGSGDGSLSSNGPHISSCGDITITGGRVTATGGNGGAGIGSGRCSEKVGGSYCGHITITGGTITATGSTVTAGTYKLGSAGIGTGYQAKCGNITIGGTATGTATQGENNLDTCYDIGTGYNGICGTISVASGTISGTIPQ